MEVRMEDVFWSSLPAGSRHIQCFHVIILVFCTRTLSSVSSMFSDSGLSEMFSERKSREESRWQVNGVSPSDPTDPGFYWTGGYFPNGRRRDKNTSNHKDLNSPQTEVIGVEAHGWKRNIYQTVDEAFRPNSTDQKQLKGANLLILLIFMIEPLIMMKHSDTDCFSKLTSTNTIYISILVNIKQVKRIKKSLFGVSLRAVMPEYRPASLLCER